MVVGEQHGYTRDYLMSQADREHNTPLHSAVNSGDLEASGHNNQFMTCVQSVKVCLEFGARVDTRQDDRSTALHLACSQGSMAIVRLLYDAHKKQSTKGGDELLHVTDVCGTLRQAHGTIVTCLDLCVWL